MGLWECYEPDDDCPSCQGLDDNCPECDPDCDGDEQAEGDDFTEES